MNILVDKNIDHTQQNYIIKSKNIICPECNEDIKIKIQDYEINLFECKNKHNINHICFDEFNSTQYIDTSKIICRNCETYHKGNSKNNKFYRCNFCKKNFCSICVSDHDKNHDAINYDDKDYICEKHNIAYISYCENCKENLCKYCEQNHKKHKIIFYEKLIPNDNKKNNMLKQIENTKNKIINDIYRIIARLNDLKDNLINYYDIILNIINNFNKEKINYEILYNINHIDNKDIIKDINNIIKENNIKNKFAKLYNLYHKMNNSITIVHNNTKSCRDIRLFSECFVDNNIKNCIMIIDNKEYKLFEKFNVQDYKKDKIIIKLKGINNITNMSGMFGGCYYLSSLPDISKWNTINVNNMSGLFRNCELLSSLPDISKWNTSNVKDMNLMFECCKSLSSLPDISKWDIINVNNISQMFRYCKSLISLPDISRWDISNVKDMNLMFSNCESLISLPDISKWNTINVINMNSLFSFCSSISSLPDISKWTTTNVVSIGYMFYCCSSLLSIPDLSKWDISNLRNNNEMFYRCSKLVNIPKIEKNKKSSQ